MWYCGQRNEEFAKVCRERDELKRELEETKELLEAAKSAQSLLQIHLVKVEEERNALEKIVGESNLKCDYCKHVGVLQGCGLDGPCRECVELEKCVCGKCKSGSMFEYRGVEVDHG